MAQLPNPFDATAIEPMATYDVMPAGKYPMAFVESEMKDTAAGTGQYLQLTAEILDGTFKGRKVWARLNLVNPNATAVDIANREFSSICHAVGKPMVTDSAELHNIPFLGEVKIEPAKGQYDARNAMKGYESLGQGAPTAPAPAANAPAPAAAGGFPAWAGQK